MPDNKTISLGLWALGLLGTVVCMAVSAAGMKSETYVIFVFTILFILFGFIFAMLYAQEERIAERKLLRKRDSHLELQRAFSAMDAYESAVAAGDSESELQQKLAAQNLAAVQAVLAYGEVTLSQKQLAMAATSRAVSAVKELESLTVQGVADTELHQAQAKAETLCCEALRAIRTMPQN